LENPWKTAIEKRPLVRSRSFGLIRPAKRQRHCLAACLLDLVDCRLAEPVSAHDKLLAQIAFSEDFDANIAALNQACLAQHFLSDFGTSIKTLQLTDIDDDGIYRERDSKAALRQTALNGSLTALEVQLAEIAGMPSLLALHTFTRRLAFAATGTATHAPFRTPSAYWGRKL